MGIISKKLTLFIPILIYLKYLIFTLLSVLLHTLERVDVLNSITIC